MGGISQTFTPPAENGIPSRKESAVQFIFEHELQYVDFSSVFADGWRTESEFIHSEGQKVKVFNDRLITEAENRKKQEAEEAIKKAAFLEQFVKN